MESHNFQFVTHTQIWGPDDNFTEEGDHECAGMRRSNPLLKLNVCSCERDGAGEQSQPAVGRSHNVTWAIRHSAVNRAGSANARGGFYKSRCLLFFFFFLIARARQACLCSTVPLWGSLNRFTWKEIRQSRHYIKKRAHIPISGLHFSTRTPMEQCLTFNFQKKGGGALRMSRKQHI